jgi:hypothetical protein
MGAINQNGIAKGNFMKTSAAIAPLGLLSLLIGMSGCVVAEHGPGYDHGPGYAYDRDHDHDRDHDRDEHRCDHPHEHDEGCDHH